MSGVAITLMILVCGFVWGGFVLLLARAVRREGEKREGEKRGGRDTVASR